LRIAKRVEHCNVFGNRGRLIRQNDRFFYSQDVRALAIFVGRHCDEKTIDEGDRSSSVALEQLWKKQRKKEGKRERREEHGT